MISTYQGILALIIGFIIGTISKLSFGETLLVVIAIALLIAGIILLKKEDSE